MKTKEYKLENGITVRDARELSCGVWIEGVRFRNFDIHWNPEEGLNIISFNKRISESQIKEFASEFNSVVSMYNQINQLLNDNRTN
jgi:hypothetical protein